MQMTGVNTGEVYIVEPNTRVFLTYELPMSMTCLFRKNAKSLFSRLPFFCRSIPASWGVNCDSVVGGSGDVLFKASSSGLYR